MEHTSEGCKVSVCCLAYNHEKYIRQALDSMVNQKTSFPYEILVLDDCSTDNTRKIIEEYMQRYPQKVIGVFQAENQYQKGVPVVNAIFYPRAKGTYIAYCEGDDYWCDETKLQQQADFLDHHPEYVSVSHECLEVDEHGRKLQDYYFNGCYKQHYDLKTHCSMQILSGQTATIMHRREAFLITGKEALRDLGRLKITGDIKKTAILMLSGPMYHTGLVMSHHRRVYKGGDSWSAQKADENLRIFYFNALDELSGYIRKYYGRTVDYEPFKIKMTATSFYMMLLGKESFRTLRYMHNAMKKTPGYPVKLTAMLIRLPFIRMNIRRNRKKEKRLNEAYARTSLGGGKSFYE